MSNEMIHVSSVGQGALAIPARNTLDEVLNDPTIHRDFGGKDGRLSPAQAGLAAAVAVKMQDRLLEQSELAHQRELSLIGGLWKLYRTPILQMSRPNDSGVAGAKKQSALASLFSWGNVLGGSAIIIVALAYYFTSTTANYKANWEAAESEKKELSAKLESEQKASEAQSFELGKALARAEELEKVNDTLTASTADLGGDLRRKIDELSRVKGELARQAAIATGEKKFQRMYNDAQKEIEKLRREISRLERRNGSQDATTNP